MNNNLAYDVGGRFNLGKAGLAEGTNANTIKTVAAVNFVIDGIQYAKAITDNIAMTALAAQAAGTTCLYTVGINASGAVVIVKGEEKDTADLNAGEAVCEWPRLDDAYAPLGGFRIVTVGVTFTSGTTDLAAAGITDTFWDFFSMPSKPITSST